MSRRPHSSSTWSLFSFTAALLFCIGNLTSVFGQIPSFPGDSRINSSPNPNTTISRPTRNKGSANRAKQASGNLPQPSDVHLDEKQQAIERAIEQGNKERDKNNYEQALAHYRKVANDLNPQEARVYYGMGNLYSDLYCHDSAIAAYVQALELKKDYLEALVSLGYAYINKDRFDDAEKQFEQARNLKPKNVEVNIGLGKVYVKKGKYQEAIRQIDQLIKDQSLADKDRAAAYVALGDVYWKQEKWQETIAHYEKAISLNPGLATAYLSLGAAQMTSAFTQFNSIGLEEVAVQDRERLAASAKQAANNIQKAMIEHHYSRPDGYLFLSHALMHQGRYQEAVSKINTYLAKVKELENRLTSIDTDMPAKCDYGFSHLNAQGYRFLGFVYFNESSLENDKQRKTELLNEAVEKYKQAIKLKQDYAGAYHMLGLIYARQGKYEEAIEQYKKAILYATEESSRASHHRNIGLLYSMMGNKDKVSNDKAIEHIREAIRRDPNNPSFYESLAAIYVSQGNLEETFKLLRKADEVRTTPSTSPDPYYKLGAAYLIRFMRKRSEEDFNEAIKWLKKVVEIRPDYPGVNYALGLAYWKHSDADEALTNYKKAAEYDPKNPDIYFRMAQVYFDLKHNTDAAIQLLKQVIELKPDHTEAYVQLGRAYRHKKDDAEAIKQLQNAIKYDPKHLQAYLDLADIYKSRKNYPEAVKHLTKATEIAPTDFYPYKELAKIYEEQGKVEEAVSYYEEALNRLKADESSTKNLYLGRIARLKGQYAEAIEYFRQVNFPEGPAQTYYEIGVTYVVSKNKRAAQEQYQQLVQLKSPLADELLKKIQEMK